MDDICLLRSLGVVRPGRRDIQDGLADAFPGIAPRPGARRRIFDERRTIGLMLGQALGRNMTCKSAVRRVQVEFGENASSSTAAYCKARRRVRAESVRTMSAELSRKADALCDACGFSRVEALDGTTFQTADTAENLVEWPYANGQREGCGFPVVGALMAHSLIGGGSEVLVTAPWNAHDFRLFVAAVPKFMEGDLLIGDRAFCSYVAFALLGERKAAGIFRGPGWCLKTREDDTSLGEGDRLTTWDRSQARHSRTFTKDELDAFPESIRVRVVTATVHERGFRDVKLAVVTSLLDAVKYPKQMILEWYLRRWEIEVSFRDMKTTLRYDFIRSRTPQMVTLEMEILLLAYNFMRYVMARGGGGKNKPRFGIASTSDAVRSFLSVVQLVYTSGRSCARAFVRLISVVSSDCLPRRKRKPYVRAVKRRPKAHPLLMKPRSQYLSAEIK